MQDRQGQLGPDQQLPYLDINPRSFPIGTCPYSHSSLSPHGSFPSTTQLHAFSKHRRLQLIMGFLCFKKPRRFTPVATTQPPLPPAPPESPSPRPDPEGTNTTAFPSAFCQLLTF